MAKQMFYTLQEAAERLGVDEQAVKDMAGEGKLQQFRDRDQLMFKRAEVEGLAGGAGGGASDDSGELSLADDADAGTAGTSGDSGAGGAGKDDSSTIPLAEDSSSGESGLDLSADDTSLTGSGSPDDSGTGTGTIDLADDSLAGSSMGEEDPNQGTGVSVFDADEVETADPMAQTQVNRPMIGDEEAALENVGSGSGLLDLTRESDDTSLGAAELLDEIYPTGGEGGADDSGASGLGSSGMDSAMATDIGDSNMGSSVGSSGVLEATQAGTEEGGEFETMGAGATQVEFEQQPGEAMSEAPIGAGYSYAEPDDPIGSGFGAGMLIGVTITLVVGLLVSLGALMNVRIAVIDQMTASTNALLIWCAGLLVLSIALGVVGLLIGKAIAGASATAQPVASAAE